MKRLMMPNPLERDGYHSRPHDEDATCSAPPVGSECAPDDDRETTAEEHDAELSALDPEHPANTGL